MSHTYKENFSLYTPASAAGEGRLLKSVPQKLYVLGSFLSEYQQVCSASFLLPYNRPILMICILFWTTVIVNWSTFFNLGMAASHV